MPISVVFATLIFYASAGTGSSAGDSVAASVAVSVATSSVAPGSSAEILFTSPAVSVPSSPVKSSNALSQ